jgi:murE/murF fusion protein
MLELGKHSKKLHQSIAATINKTNIDKVFIKGRFMKLMFEKLSDSKKGRVLSNKSQIIDLIRNDLNNNDSLMVKASNATGFNKIIKELKGVN